MKIDKDDIYTIILVIALSIFFYFVLWLGSASMETQYLIAEMGEDTYKEIVVTLERINGKKPTDAQIANYYVEFYK